MPCSPTWIFHEKSQTQREIRGKITEIWNCETKKSKTQGVKPFSVFLKALNFLSGLRRRLPSRQHGNAGMGLSHQEVAVQQRGRRVDFSSQTGERERVGYHTSSLDQPS